MRWHTHVFRQVLPRGLKLDVTHHVHIEYDTFSSRSLVISHKDDCPDPAITGKYILRWSENDEPRKNKRPHPKVHLGISFKHTVMQFWLLLIRDRPS